MKNQLLSVHLCATIKTAMYTTPHRFDLCMRSFYNTTVLIKVTNIIQDNDYTVSRLIAGN